MKIGFIGCGNMGAAMAAGILKSGLCSRTQLMASAVSDRTKSKIREELEICLADSNTQVAEFADLVFLAVKPKYYESVIREIRGSLDQETIVVSIAPGKTLEQLEGLFEKPVKLVRAMPNTPAMAVEGMTAYCANAKVTEHEKAMAASVCGCFGKAEEVDESMMDAVTSVSGSSPAYVFLFIEAMADAAVADGMPRAQAYTFAAQAVLGSAKMVLKTGMHPGALKDMVCSPGGTTIEAVRVLEERGMRSSVIEAMKACAKKAGEM